MRQQLAQTLFENKTLNLALLSNKYLCVYECIYLVSNYYKHILRFLPDFEMNALFAVLSGDEGNYC